MGEKIKKWIAFLSETSHPEDSVAATINFGLLLVCAIIAFLIIFSFSFVHKAFGWVNIKMLVSESALIFTYVVSRFLRKTNLAKVLILIVSLISIGFFWFEANGILGAMPFYVLLFITVSHTIWESKHHRKIGFFTIAFSIFYLVLEFLYPHWVTPYPTVIAEKMNTSALLLLITLASSFAMRYFKVSFESSNNALKQQNEELISTNKELDYLLYSISHDLRSPIASLQGLITLQKETENEEERERYLLLQERSLARLDNFIRDMLEYSRIHRAELKTEQVNVPEIVGEIAEQMTFYHKDKKVEIVLDTNFEKTFFSDPTKLHIILQNLITNAVHYADFSKENPYCKVIVKAEDDNTMRIEIEDNGIGIDERHGNKIFEMFYRGSNDRKGTGIGLYIVQKSVNRIQGQIHFHSQRGKGTTFVVKIPNQIEKNGRKTPKR